MANKKTRMSIDIAEKEHKKIKMRAAKDGVSIRKFVIGCVQEKIIPEPQSHPKGTKS